MKINEVEKQTGIPSTNIRYYEKMGLLHPQRNEENNYRSYSESDIDQLERIKTLRTLGIKIEDLKELFQDESLFHSIMKERAVELQDEKKKLAEAETICEKILSEHIELEEVNSIFKDVPDTELQKNLVDVFKEDRTKERIVNWFLLVDFTMNIILFVYGIVSIIILNVQKSPDYQISTALIIIPLIFVLAFIICQILMFKKYSPEQGGSGVSILRAVSVWSIVLKCMILFMALIVLIFTGQSPF